MSGIETPVPATPNRYLEAAKPHTVGQLRCRLWKTMEWGLDPRGSELWVKRCGEYWTLQARLYGVRFSAFALMGSEDDGAWVIGTYAVVAEVYPGSRI